MLLPLLELYAGIEKPKVIFSFKIICILVLTYRNIYLLGENRPPHRPAEDDVKAKSLQRRAQRRAKSVKSLGIAENAPDGHEQTEMEDKSTNEGKLVPVSRNMYEYVMKRAIVPQLNEQVVMMVTRAALRRRLSQVPFQFETPFRLLLVGQPQAGKTNATACILNNGHMTQAPEYVYLIRRHHQDIYDRMLNDFDHEVLDSFEEFDLNQAPDNSCLIVDDFGHEMADSREFSSLLSSSGHKGLSIICLVPHLYNLGRKSATQRLLYTHIACFKTPFQYTRTFINQLYVEDRDAVDCLYEQVQSTPHSLLLFNLKQARRDDEPMVRMHTFPLF